MERERSGLYSAAGMPIYEYRCENGHLFEVMQKITEEPVTQCEVCGAPARDPERSAGAQDRAEGW